MAPAGISQDALDDVVYYALTSEVGDYPTMEEYRMEMRRVRAELEEDEFSDFTDLPSLSFGLDDDSSMFSLPSLDSLGSDSTQSSDDTITRYFQECVELENNVPPTTIDVDVNCDPRMNLCEPWMYSNGNTEYASEPRFRSANEFGYTFGNFMRSNYYEEFLSPAVRERVRVQSRSKFSVFRSHFRTTLDNVEYLTNMFIERGWVSPTKRVKGERFVVRTTLLVMSALEHLGNRKPFRQFKTATKMSPALHSCFFDVFLDRLVENVNEWIKFPDTMDELQDIIKQYQAHKLPGCCGSIDVVHCKWSCCPAGDKVRSTGKEKYPTLGFECVTNNCRRILGVSGVQYGTRNDMHIVRLDRTVKKIREEWYKDVKWECFDIEGVLHEETGLYLICDGGYLRWRTLICPYPHENNASRKGYFSTNLESVRKDVECTFGILKKRWRILEFGMQYRSIKKCEKVFLACCILHNMMLSEVSEQEFRTATIGMRGVPLEGEAIYVGSPVSLHEPRRSRRLADKEKQDAKDWARRRDLLSQHLAFSKLHE